MYLETEEVIEEQMTSDLDISYKLLYLHGFDVFNKASKSESIVIDSQMIDRYWEDLKNHYFLQLNARSPTVKGLFLLYQTANALSAYNTNILKMSNIQFRSRILFPYLIYILQQYLPDARKFLQTIIKNVYDRIHRNSEKLVNVYVNSFYLDQDVIKHNILLEFLGNGLKKFNPLLVGKIDSFYKSMFASIFHFYFMKKQDTSKLYTNFWNIENILSSSNSSTRLNLYRDVLYNLQVDKYYKTSPIYIQLGMNYRIFKNVIVNNELQDVYMAVRNNGNSIFKITNPEYKLIKVYSDDLINEKTIEKIRKLPTIFKLLKCVHIANPKAKPYNDMLIKPELVKSVILDELSYPFKNVFSDGYLQPILTRISENFVGLVLSGEYINLMTLTNVRIDQISFVEQLKKFVKICLSEIQV
ncbi:MAG TPA: hypothetical protein PLL26_02335 [Candidatus Dojkabacteria bacterium]|nr:hypothetical protein [Candidatus Dojkabacteria bacterium]